MAKNFKKYGRLNLNKLDWLLAIVFVVIGVAALWISLGISIANAGDYAGKAFLDLALALGFVADASKYGQAAVVSAYSTVIIYGSLLLLILGTLYLVKKGLKDRIPGLVAEFVAALGAGFFICFAYEFGFASTQTGVNKFWPLSLIIFIVVLFALMVIAIYATFNTNVDVSLEKKTEEPDDEMAEEQPEEKEEPAEEPQEEEKEEEPEEEPQPEPEEEAQPEEEPEEEAEEEAEDEGEEDAEEEGEEAGEGEADDNGFSGLGKRRKKIPFENKLRRAEFDTRERYKYIVSELRQYDLNDRKSIPGETFSYKREKLVFITFSGSTLKVHFKLDPKEFEDSPIPAKDASDTKKYEDTPMYLKVKSDLAARRVVALAKKVFEEHNVPEK